MPATAATTNKTHVTTMADIALKPSLKRRKVHMFVVCFQTKTSYKLSLFDVNKRLQYAHRHTHFTLGLQCLFLIPPDNVVLCYVAKLVASAEICLARMQGQGRA